MTERRTFLGTVVAAVVFPWFVLRGLGERAACLCLYGRQAGWHTVRRKVGDVYCSARYRWNSDRGVEWDYVQMQCERHIGPGEIPTLFVDYDATTVGFSMAGHETVNVTKQDIVSREAGFKWFLEHTLSTFPEMA